MPFPPGAFSGGTTSSGMSEVEKLFLAEHGDDYGAPTDSVLTKMKNSRANCAWNLPPHKWSVLRSSGLKDRTERRGKIYFMAVDTGQEYAVKYHDKKKTSESQKLNKNMALRKYGFRFLWNPDTYVSQTALQMDIVPSGIDVFVSKLGLFPGSAQISFTIRLDRTHDFACFRGKYPKGDVSAAAGADLIKNFYSAEGRLKDEDPSPNDRVVPSVSKLKWLLQMGTLADIEYLYRAINDITVVSKLVGPKREFKSADIGFLGYSMLVFELGPVYYTGFLTGISINHITFTEDYIPIVTDVTINANVMSYANVTSGGKNSKEG